MLSKVTVLGAGVRREVGWVVVEADVRPLDGREDAAVTNRVDGGRDEV